MKPAPTAYIAPPRSSVAKYIIVGAVDNRPYGEHCAVPFIHSDMSVVGAGLKPAPTANIVPFRSFTA
ncbi:MAG: hypothetical protein LBI54_04635, partial [Lachnospiraceae bacterium]|nr:hypothetical protein [Lachnospiraceae bacterium]